MTRLILKTIAVSLIAIIILDQMDTVRWRNEREEWDAIRKRVQQERRNPPTRHSEDDVMGMYGEGDDATL